MMSRTGNKQGFTLIEVLLAVAILSIGMIGVIRAYVVLMNGIEASRFTVEACYLLKNRMADVQTAAIEGTVDRGLWTVDRDRGMGGNFEKGYASFKWEEDITRIRIERDKPKEYPEKEPEEEAQEFLDKVHISVSGGEDFGPVRKMSLYTYLESRPE